MARQMEHVTALGQSGRAAFAGCAPKVYEYPSPMNQFHRVNASY